MNSDWKEKLVLNLRMELDSRGSTDRDNFIHNSYWLGFDINAPEFKSYLFQLHKDKIINIGSKVITRGENYDL